MPLIPTSDDLRTLNLAYRHLQQDFRIFQPELFRVAESLTTDASGYIYLPLYALEVEDIRDGNNNKVDKIDPDQRFTGSGYYHDGMSTSGASDGKRRIMIRDSGKAKASGASYSVQFLREYDDLASTSAKPYPFTGKMYLDMLTNLQAWYWLAEQGKERKSEKDDRFGDYQNQLQKAGFNLLDDEPEYLQTTHADAGSRNSYPILNPSTSS